MKRALVLLTSMALTGLAAPACAAEAAAAPPPVRAPHYGDGLFHFFQSHTLDALGSLMTSQHFQRLGEDADNAQLLEGGLMLSYGMHRQAAEVFERLLAQNPSPTVRQRAWYYLARVQYARGLWAEAGHALAQMGDPLPAALDTSRRLLLAQLRLQQNDPAGAAQALQPLALDEQLPTASTDPLQVDEANARWFARFNLGVALMRQGFPDEARHWLTTVGTHAAANEEQRHLRDRANLALGFAALQADEPQAAQQALERVRLQGPESDKALLGFGWAAMGLDQPERALVSWRELLSRDASDTAVLEARLAVPHALAALGADADALAGYQQALDAFANDLKNIDDAMSALGSTQWLDELLAHNPGAGLDWSGQMASLAGLPPHAQIAPLLASNAFQEGFKTWRDMRQLSEHLQRWQDKLLSFDDMLAQRRIRLADAGAAVQRRADQIDLQPLVQRQAALTQALATADEQADGRAFADARQREQADRLARVAQALARLGADAPPLAATQHRLAQGVLQWDLAQALPERRWRAAKALQGSRSGLDTAQASQAALAQARHDEAQRLAGFDTRIAALRQRITGLLPALQALEQAQAQALRQALVEHLREQQARLEVYRTQASFAMAQLHDRARHAEPEAADAAH